MRTEIVIPFAFDTTPIEQKLQDVGTSEVNRRVDELIEQKVYDSLPKVVRSWNGDTETDWKSYIDSRIDAYLDEHVSEVIETAAILMAARGSRRKAWKDVLAEYKEEQQ